MIWFFYFINRLGKIFSFQKDTQKHDDDLSFEIPSLFITSHQVKEFSARLTAKSNDEMAHNYFVASCVTMHAGFTT